MVATTNEAELTMANGCKPKMLKEVATCFFTASSKALVAMNDDQACLSAKDFHVIGSPFLQLVQDTFLKVGVIDYLAKYGMKVLLGLTGVEPGRKMSVHDLVACAKERSSSAQKESIRQQASRGFGFYLQLNYELRKNGWLPNNPKVLGQRRRKSGGRFYAKHTKEIEGHAIIHKRAIEMINEATTNDLKKEEIQDHLCNAWKCIFNEECLGLDGNGLSGVRDTNKEEEHSDLAGGNVDGATGSADVLKENIDSAAIDTEENRQRQLEMATR